MNNDIGIDIHYANKARITTDNTAVIRALEKRVEELEAEKMEIARHDCAQVLANDRLLLAIEGLKAENQRLRNPDWVTYVTLTRAWLEKYPPDIFTGVSGDPGPLFVVAVRNALIELGGGE